MKRLAILICILFAVGTGAFGCAALSKKTQKQPTKSIVVLVDLSISTAPVRPVYASSFEKILESVGHGDAVTAAKITDSSITEPEIPVNKEFPPFVALDSTGKPTDNQLLVEKAKKEADQRILQEKKLLLSSFRGFVNPQVNTAGKAVGTPRTDIMSSLIVAQNVFKSQKRDNNVLVIMSDMVEDSVNYSFPKEKLTDDRIAEIINNEKANGRLPDLSGVKVYVVAAGSKDSNQFLQVRKFWLRYLKEAGAIINEENYGNSLIGFSV